MGRGFGSDWRRKGGSHYCRMTSTVHAALADMAWNRNLSILMSGESGDITRSTAPIPREADSRVQAFWCARRSVGQNSSITNRFLRLPGVVLRQLSRHAAVAPWVARRRSRHNPVPCHIQRDALCRPPALKRRDICSTRVGNRIAKVEIAVSKSFARQVAASPSVPGNANIHNLRDRRRPRGYWLPRSTPPRGSPQRVSVAEPPCRNQYRILYAIEPRYPRRLNIEPSICIHDGKLGASGPVPFHIGGIERQCGDRPLLR
jgi:hypothetical protein